MTRSEPTFAEFRSPCVSPLSVLELPVLESCLNEKECSAASRFFLCGSSLTTSHNCLKSLLFPFSDEPFTRDLNAQTQRHLQKVRSPLPFFLSSFSHSHCHSILKHSHHRCNSSLATTTQTTNLISPLPLSSVAMPPLLQRILSRRTARTVAVLSATVTGLYLVDTHKNAKAFQRTARTAWNG